MTSYYNRLLVGLVRYIARKDLHVSADETLSVPSRDGGRDINVNVYGSKLSPSPVLINFHGSGFVLHQHGEDDDFCRQIADETEYTVLDVQYRLGPEDPWPAAPEDVEDVVRWVQSQTRRFCPDRISLSGFSAGANLVLGASGVTFETGTFERIICFYPPCDLSRPSTSKVAPDQSGKPIPAWIADVFNNAYDPSGKNRKEPTLSPTYADPARFPAQCLFFTCAQDSLCEEAEELADRISQCAGKSVIVDRQKGCGHAWDKSAVAGSHQERCKQEAYQLVISALNGTQL